MKYNDLNQGQIEAVVNKLGGMEGVKNFLSGKMIVVKPIFKIWKTIKIGVHKNLKELATTMAESGFRPNLEPSFFYHKFKFIEKEENLDLVIVHSFELGFFQEDDVRSTYEGVCARGKELGLELCPDEVGPLLFLEYMNQYNEGQDPLKTGHRFVIAMEPMYYENCRNFYEVSNFVYRKNDVRPYLNTSNGTGYFGGVDDYTYLVFCIRK